MEVNWSSRARIKEGPHPMLNRESTATQERTIVIGQIGGVGLACGYGN